MLITTSKNASVEAKSFAKRLCMHIPDAEYISRGGRSLEQIMQKAKEKGGKGLLSVSLDFEKVLISKYECKKGICNWEDNALVLHSFNFYSNPQEGDLPVKIVAKKKGEKGIAKFFGLEDDLAAAIYSKKSKIKIEEKKGEYAILEDGKKLMEAKISWEGIGDV